MRPKSVPFAKLKSRLKKFGNEEDAVVAIEFGFIMPVFLLLLCIFIETSAMMFKEYAIQAGLQESSRMIRTGQAQNGGWSLTTFKATTCDVAKVVTECESRLKVFVKARTTFAQMNTATPYVGALGTGPTGQQPETFQCGAPLEVVAVIATYDYPFIMPLMQFFANTSDSGFRRISASVMFRNEPFSVVGACV
jgi:Flp pilus assembly protein TadG